MKSDTKTNATQAATRRNSHRAVRIAKATVPTAAEAYDAAQSNASALVEALTAKLKRHYTETHCRSLKTGRPINWANVGDIHRITAALAELLDA